MKKHTAPELKNSRAKGKSMINTIHILLFSALVIGNIWGIVFVYIPLLQRRSKISDWVCLSISISAIVMCSFQLGRMF